ncbi:TraM recognition domain-containing protein [Nocardia sp. NBC_01388]|uniref:type IV secretory system conjugative DNA transfer family protein n=1 Tax=Nocardia sp. NBC_01388 TaxID=2903596 RepID=UPI002F91145B
MDRSVKAPTGEEMDPEWRQVYIAGGLAVGVSTLTEMAALSIWVSPVFGATPQDVPLHNPFSLYWRIFAAHEIAWPVQAWAGLGTVAVATLAGVAGTAVGTRWVCERAQDMRADRRERRKTRTAARGGQRAARRDKPKALPIDAQARYLARGTETSDLSYQAMVAKAHKLGVVRGPDGAPGVSIGESILDPQMLYGSYEDLHLDVMGPRAGKSSSRVIPALMEAIGPVVATSNKRDVVDATRGHRADLGGQVWVFDPQQVAAEACTWFWDPIAWVAGTDGGADAQVRAAQLAGHFAAGGDADKADSFFDPEGEDLLAGLILAAAVSKKPITQVFLWITDQQEEEPIDVLREHGYQMVAAALNDQYTAPDRQRKGIFSTAKKMASCLKYDKIRPWVEPPKPGEAEREPFDVRAFATSRDSLYPLSLEGKGTAGPLITALTAAVVDAASHEGVRRGGRLPVPMLVALDEAANIVKWAELPKMYSHFGSRGIVVMTILQSWAQGVRCWGEEGMKALWSAANIRTLGPGLADAAFLRDISDLVGAHYEQTSSVTHNKSKDGRSSSRSISRTTEPTLTPSDLAAIPTGRALVLASGHRPVLVRLVPWWERSCKDAVEASNKKFAPKPITDLVDGWNAPPATREEGEQP